MFFIQKAIRKTDGFLFARAFSYHCGLKYRVYILSLALILPVLLKAQNISFCTDLTVQHNFKQEQKYTTIGQTIQLNIMLNAKEGIYTWFTYYANGNFHNDVIARARTINIIPQEIPYRNSAKMRLKQFSLGYKKYFLGSSENENSLNLYGYIGFGIELGRVTNTHSKAIDTSIYDLPVLSGQANFKRLTLDPGIGVDHYLGGDLYVYSEARLWIPTSDYPSRYIYKNENAPWVAMACLGIRILF